MLGAKVKIPTPHGTLSLKIPPGTSNLTELRLRGKGLPQGTGDPITIGQVPSESHCAPETGGWYYDDPLDPKQILFCPSTCEAIRMDADAEVQLLIGCETIPA